MCAPFIYESRPCLVMLVMSIIVYDVVYDMIASYIMGSFLLHKKLLYYFVQS